MQLHLITTVVTDPPHTDSTRHCNHYSVSVLHVSPTFSAVCVCACVCVRVCVGVGVGVHMCAPVQIHVLIFVLHV